MARSHISISTKRQLLLWTDQWFPFCAAATISWRQWVLLLSDQAVGNFGNVIFLIAALCTAVVVDLVVRHQDKDNQLSDLVTTIFNNPHVVEIFFVFALIGWVIGIPAAFTSHIPVWIYYLGTASAGVACTGFFIMWAEVFVHVDMSQATFTLALCLAVSGLIDQVTRGTSGVAFLIIGLLLIGVSAAGIHRAGVMLIGPSLKTVQEHKNVISGDQKSVLSLSASIFILCMVLFTIKTVGTGLPVMEFSLGVSFSGAIILALMVFLGHVSLNWLWRISLPFLFFGASVALLRGSVPGNIGLIICDIPLGMLALMAASIGVHYFHTHSESVIHLACVAFSALIVADLLGFYGTTLLMNVAHVNSDLIILLSTLVAIISVMICLVWNDTLQVKASTFTGFSAFSAGEGLSYLRPITDAAKIIHPNENGLRTSTTSSTDESETSSVDETAAPSASDSSTFTSERPTTPASEQPAASTPAHLADSSAQSAISSQDQSANSSQESTQSTVEVAGPSSQVCLLPTTLSRAKKIAAAVSQTFSLRDRETEVLAQLLTGESAGQVAVDLFIARGTVKAHIHNIYEKIGVHNREDLCVAVQKAYEKILVEKQRKEAQEALKKADHLQQQMKKNSR